MHVVAINGSPRKHWNTWTLLEKALEGAASKGATTQMVHLYDLNFKGCKSCFTCKLKGGESYGKCIINDELTSVLADVANADGLLLGTPIYLGAGSGDMRSLLSRLLFPYWVYTDPITSLFTGKLHVGLIFTLGAPEELALQRGYDKHMTLTQMMVSVIFGKTELLVSYDTMQFENQDLYVAPRWDPVQKQTRRREVFPEECKEAFALGARLISEQSDISKEH